MNNTGIIHKYIKNEALILTFYSIMHLLVDALCAFTVFKWIYTSAIGVETIFILIIAYNIFAFGTQPILGYFTDRVGKPAMLSAVGIVVVLTGCISGPVSPLISIFLLGLGNSLFHVAGGSICLNLKYDRTFSAGIYVGPGDIGIVMGTLLGKSLISLEMYAIILLISFILIFIICKVYDKSGTAPLNKLNFTDRVNSNAFSIILILIMICIVVRAFIGGSITFSWKNGTIILLLASVIVTGGKIAGGIFSLFLSKKVVAVGGLLISAPLLAFIPGNIYAGLIGLFLFNLTMPITLSVTADLFPRYTGFAFGLTAGALLIGTFPGFYKTLLPAFSEWFIFLVIISSAIVLYIALEKFGKHQDQKNQMSKGENSNENLLMEGYNNEKSKVIG